MSDDRRAEALNQAIRSMGYSATAKDIAERAETFYRFLSEPSTTLPDVHVAVSPYEKRQPLALVPIYLDDSSPAFLQRGMAARERAIEIAHEGEPA